MNDFDHYKMMRRDKRFETMNLVSIEIYDGKGNGIYQGMCKTLNLSMSGMLLEMYDDTPLQLNYGINCEIGLHGSEVISLKGIIRWLHSINDSITIGVQFLPLTKNTNDTLQLFLEQFKD